VWTNQISTQSEISQSDFNRVFLHYRTDETGCCSNQSRGSQRSSLIWLEQRYVLSAFISCWSIRTNWFKYSSSIKWINKYKIILFNNRKWYTNTFTSSSEHFYNRLDKQSNDHRSSPYGSQISLSLTGTTGTTNGSSQGYHSILTSPTITTVENLNKENIRTPLSLSHSYTLIFFSLLSSHIFFFSIFIVVY